MPFLLLSAFLLFVSYPLIGSANAIWVLMASQLTLLMGQIARRQVTSVGAFIFMSFLFFSMRPIYILIENDRYLFNDIYRIRVSTADLGDAMWWASLALWAFAAAAYAAPKIYARYLLRRRARNALITMRPEVSGKSVSLLIGLQLATLPLMLGLAVFGRTLYRSALGAYAYDFPVLMQSVHIFAMVVLLERWLRRKTTTNMLLLGFSGFLFLDFTWLMREVSIFRGFYLTGVMIAGIAIVQRFKGRAGFAWLLVPIIGLQPFFQYLGADRNKGNDEMAETGLVDRVFDDQTVGEAYWNFYSGTGDMNIFDTFVAAKKSEPAFRPYLWSWLYVPLHFVPRALWEGKPKRGITQDMTFTNKAPTSPGIAGFFLLDGGLVWMLGSMALLGFLLSMLDWYILTMPRGYLQAALIGIVTINAMFLTRVFLWQYFYQLLYALVPCVVLSWYFTKNATRMSAASRNSRRSMQMDPGRVDHQQ
jgi:hypothetical protein